MGSRNRRGWVRILALVLIVAGVLGLVYGKLTYTKKTHDAKLGPFEFAFKDKETVRIPEWASLAAVAGGVLLLLVPRR